MKFLLLAALPLATSLLFAPAASAADLSYTYLEAGYDMTDLDDTGTDAEGWRLGGSAALGSQFFLFGSYTANDLDDLPVDVDVTRIGFGWHTGLADRHDLVLQANWIEADADAGIVSASVDGYEAEVGVRSSLTPNFETYAALGWVDTDEFDGELYGKLGAQYRFNATWGITATATLGEDATELFVGPRISF